MSVMLPAPRLLADGFVMIESGRWHDGRLWFAHWGAGEVMAVDLQGRTEVVASGRTTMGWAIDWLHDGGLLVSGEDLTLTHPDGSSERYSAQGGNEIVVDPAGHVYVNGADFDFGGGGEPTPGWIRLVVPDGSTRPVADDIEFPNGMVVTPDGSTLVIAESFAGRLSAFDISADGSLSGRRTWAENLGPDGICIDDEGGIWSQTADTFAHTLEQSCGYLTAARLPTGSRPVCRVSPAPWADRRAGTCSSCATSSRESTNSRRCRRGAAPASM
jgi:sugar lactone lactonase YvrE